MRCPNIIIVREDPEAEEKEVGEAVEQLKARYAERKPVVFEISQYDLEENARQIKKLAEEAVDLSKDTGMYVVGHGSVGGILGPSRFAYGARILAEASVHVCEGGIQNQKDLRPFLLRHPKRGEQGKG